MTQQIENILYELHKSTFNNITHNIESTLDIFRKTENIKVDFIVSYDADEAYSWYYKQTFKFYGYNDELLYTYTKYPHMIIGGREDALKVSNKLKYDNPGANITFYDCTLPDAISGNPKDA